LGFRKNEATPQNPHPVLEPAPEIPERSVDPPAPSAKNGTIAAKTRAKGLKISITNLYFDINHINFSQ